MQSYSPSVLDIFLEPMGVYEQQHPLSELAHGSAKDSVSGDTVSLYLLMTRGNNIKKAYFNAYGTPSTIATAAVSTKLLTEINRSEALERVRALINILDLPATQYYSVALVEQALTNALTK